MKVNIFYFSYEWTISQVDLPLGQYSCSSPAIKVLHVGGYSRFVEVSDGTNPASFLFIFGLFKQKIQFLQQLNVNKCPNVHLVYSTGIQTHNLSNMSRHP